MSDKSSMNNGVGVGKYTCVVGYNPQTCNFVFKTFNSAAEYEEYCKTHDVNNREDVSQSREADIVANVVEAIKSQSPQSRKADIVPDSIEVIKNRQANILESVSTMRLQQKLV